ncbi:hypothetical protein [Rheinheimera sp.]|uniref:hypothetical protein n=1 Tax=Rheinheimera sp. TaxID=1869214 RepID=UPI004047ACAF
MNKTHFGWFLFILFLGFMVISGVSVAYFTVGKGNDPIWALVSSLALLCSVYLSFIKIPDWFCDIAAQPKNNSGH